MDVAVPETERGYNPRHIGIACSKLNCANTTDRAMKPEPLTDDELERLGGILNRFENKLPMNLEHLDGFIAALICGPALVPPGEYLPKILGDDMVLNNTLNAQTVLQEFLSSVMRHWNVIADTLSSGDVYLPILLQNENRNYSCQRLGNRFSSRYGVPQRSGLYYRMTKKMAVGLCRSLPLRTKTTLILRCVHTRSQSMRNNAND
jgi:uncharacterized protein